MTSDSDGAPWSLSFCRGSRVEGSMSRVEGNLFFPISFFVKGNNRCNQCH